MDLARAPRRTARKKDENLGTRMAPDDIIWGAFSIVFFSSWDVHVIACTCQDDEGALLRIMSLCTDARCIIFNNDVCRLHYF
jgi:hypothetical protein